MNLTKTLVRTIDANLQSDSLPTTSLYLENSTNHQHIQSIAIKIEQEKLQRE